MKRIEAHEVPLHELFSSDFAFHIPEYQRPYAWEREQSEQLLDDLLDALRRGEDEPYFLGSIVLVKDDGEARAEVIDGQQRLTTLTILFAILRDLAEEAELKQELDTQVQEPGSIVLDLKPQPRLRLRARDQDFFENHIQKPGTTSKIEAVDAGTLATDAQCSLRDNTVALSERLAQHSATERLGLAQMLAKRTFLVVVSTPDLTSAHRIFSVMNARGLDLSPADIFKSMVIGAIGQQEPGDAAMYADRWEDAEEELGRDGFGELFLHIRMIFAKERGRRELLKEFEEQVLSNFLPAAPRPFVDDVLVPFANAYQQLRDSDYRAGEGAKAVNNGLLRLHQIDNNDWRPPALWALRHRGDDAAWLADFFAALERLAASMLIRRVYATPRATRYATVLKELDEGADLEAESLRLSEEERADTLARLGGEIYLVAPVRRYVLLRLDEILAGAPGVSYEHPRITVEHVLPQSPAADSHWAKDFSEDERVHWTHRLANLVLLNRSRNSAAQNYDFDRKKAQYFTTVNGVAAFALTTQVLTESRWTPEVLTKRQATLTARLKQTWDL